jgi:hypothetical protein
VVIGDDQIDAKLARTNRRFRAADAAIDRDHELHTVGVQALDGRGLQAVAVAQPFRNEVHDVGAEQLERAAEDHRGGDPVHVVVAMDRDPLTSFECTENPIHGHTHVGEQHRIV